MKTYRVNKRRYYEKGMFYAEGDIITAPDDKKPSKGWDLISDDSSAKAVEPKPEAKTPAAPRGRARASDVEPTAT